LGETWARLFRFPGASRVRARRGGGSLRSPGALGLSASRGAGNRDWREAWDAKASGTEQGANDEVEEIPEPAERHFQKSEAHTVRYEKQGRSVQKGLPPPFWRLARIANMTWLAVGVGGALGSMLRHGVNVLTREMLGDSVPYATAVVNIVGCFAIGVVAGLVSTESWRIGQTTRAFVFVGVIGGFTTFSSLGLDTFTLFTGGRAGFAMANIALQLVVGFGAVFAGYSLGR